MKKLLIILICIFCFVGCSNNEDNEVELISYIDAKEKIINEGAVLMDVRTEEEYNSKHIDGAISFPLNVISEDTLGDVIDGKDTTIIVYCKSGNRSRQALEQLNELGYKNVYDLGSISNWEE